MYEQIARFYDLIHNELTDDIKRVLTLASQSHDPILELGCGTGRLLIPLARAGHTIIGLDNSPAMLDKARQRLTAEPQAVQNRVKLVEADMVDFTLDEKVGLAIVPYNTLLHLDERKKGQLFQTVGRHMDDNGRLFLDLANPQHAAQSHDNHNLTLERVMTDPDNGDYIVQMASSWADQEQQLLHITWLYDVSPAKGGPVHRTIVEADYYYIYPHQVELLLRQAGFRMAAIYGDYEGRPFDEASDRLLIMASKGRRDDTAADWRGFA